MYIKNANVIIFTDIISETIWSRTAGPYRIASEIRRNGYTCQVIDCFTALSDQQVLTLLDEIVGPDTLMVGLSTTFFIAKEGNETTSNPFFVSYPKSLATMKSYFDHIKSINPKIKIVIGGQKAQYHTAWYADTLMTGLADRAIIEYLKFLKGKNPFLRYSVNEQGQMVIDGDSYHSQFDFQNSQIEYVPHDNILDKETLVIEIGRGCIFRCKFCAYPLNGKKKNDYIKHASVLREEFLKNYYEHGITKYIYTDDTHNDNMDKLRQLADVVQSLPFKLEYSSFLRLDLMRAHPEQYDLLEAGGLKGAFFGIETLNYEAAKLIGKGLRPEAVIEELHKVRERLPHVAVTTSYIIGFPKETKETIYEWTQLLKDDNFPTDGVLINTLGMSNSKDKLYKSEFEIEAGKYFTWESENSKYWIGEHFDYHWADAYTEKLKKELEQKFRIAGLEVHTASHCSNLDFSRRSYVDVGVTLSKLREVTRQKYIKKLFAN